MRNHPVLTLVTATRSWMKPTTGWVGTLAVPLFFDEGLQKVMVPRYDMYVNFGGDDYVEK